MSIRIAVVIGTVRPGNFTSRAARLVVDELKMDGEVEADLIDPAGLNLSFPGLPSEGSRGADLKERIERATGVVLATPEYHGSFSSVMKLVIENLGFPSVLATKPVALLGVASGQIGAIKSLEQLRSVCSHVGAIVLPGPVSIANVQALFDEKGRCLDEVAEKRIRGLAHALLDYIKGSVCPRLALEEMVRTHAGRAPAA